MHGRVSFFYANIHTHQLHWVSSCVYTITLVNHAFLTESQNFPSRKFCYWQERTVIYVQWHSEQITTYADAPYSHVCSFVHLWMFVHQVHNTSFILIVLTCTIYYSTCWNGNLNFPGPFTSEIKYIFGLVVEFLYHTVKNWPTMRTILNLLFT